MIFCSCSCIIYFSILKWFWNINTVLYFTSKLWAYIYKLNHRILNINCKNDNPQQNISCSFKLIRFPALSDLDLDSPFFVPFSNELDDLDTLDLEDLSLFTPFAFFTDLTDLAGLDDLGPTDLLDFDLEDFDVLDPFADFDAIVIFLTRMMTSILTRKLTKNFTKNLNRKLSRMLSKNLTRNLSNIFRGYGLLHQKRWS